MDFPNRTDETTSDKVPAPSGGRLPLRLLRDLGGIAEEIRQRRPEAVVIGNREVAVDYRADADTGTEYAAIDVELPDPWFVELDTDCSAFAAFGGILSVSLPLD